MRFSDTCSIAHTRARVFDSRVFDICSICGGSTRLGDVAERGDGGAIEEDEDAVRLHLAHHAAQPLAHLQVAHVCARPTGAAAGRSG